MNLYIKKNMCRMVADILKEKLKDALFYYELDGDEYENIIKLIKKLENN